jgi:hypothetical protein
VDKAYLESVIPFMVSYVTPITPNPPPSTKPLPYPICIAGMDLNANVRMFRKAIQANGENNDVNIVICFILHLQCHI